MPQVLLFGPNFDPIIMISESAGILGTSECPESEDGPAFTDFEAERAISMGFPNCPGEEVCLELERGGRYA